jgi:ATP-dependent Lon protease
MPGRIIQAVRRAGVSNPILMLDEIDKLGRDFRGDPAAALMEILDPAQNKEFRDNYLNLPFDLSKVFFITTANTLEGIPRPLLDRMEVMELTGYSDREKREIARRYLIPRQIAETGLEASQLDIPDDVLTLIIRRYTREAGVRELERVIRTFNSTIREIKLPNMKRNYHYVHRDFYYYSRDIPYL